MFQGNQLRTTAGEVHADRPLAIRREITRLPGSSFPHGDQWAWGISWNGPIVSIYNAILNVGGEWIFLPGPFTKNISDDQYWLGYSFDLTDRTTLSLVSQPAIPQTIGAVLGGPLYLLRFDSDLSLVAGFDIDLIHCATPTETYR